jgi:hypothetical protein
MEALNIVTALHYVQEYVDKLEDRVVQLEMELESAHQQIANQYEKIRLLENRNK